MKKSWFLFVLFFTPVLAFAISPFDQQNQKTKPQFVFNQDVENIFQKALSHYSEKRYDIVEYELQSFQDNYPNNHRQTAIQYLIGRAQLFQKKWSAAENTLTQLLKQFPNSNYSDDACYLLAQIWFQQKKYDATAEELLTVLDTTHDPRLLHTTRDLLPNLLSDYLDAKELQSLRNQFHSDETQAQLRFAEGVQAYRNKNREAAKTIFQNWLTSFPNHPLRNDSERYLKLLTATPSSPMKIGVILPLTGYLQEEAKGLLSGIQYALKTNPAARETEIELIVKDSHDDMLATIDDIQSLLAQENLVAIIGEIESDKTAVIGALAQTRLVPVLAPTATESGLTASLPNIIQMNPDVSLRGEIIAEYAINHLNLHSFAILAPADQYGKNISDSFAQTVDQLNGTIIAETWYYEGATDLRDQFKYLRKLGLKRLDRDSLAMTLPGLSLAQIDSAINKMETMRQFTTDRRDGIPKFADSTAIPVTSIDAIFLPVYSDIIPYLAPQFALYNIRCQLLGGDYWNDEETLDNNANYLTGTIFCSDYFAEETNETFQRFRNQFRLDTGTTPGKMEIFGFDTMNFLLQGIRAGVNQPEELLHNLEQRKEFEGLLHSYNFDRKPRVNSFLNILKYQNNTITKLE